MILAGKNPRQVAIMQIRFLSAVWVIIGAVGLGCSVVDFLRYASWSSATETLSPGAIDELIAIAFCIFTVVISFCLFKGWLFARIVISLLALMLFLFCVCAMALAEASLGDPIAWLGIALATYTLIVCCLFSITQRAKAC